MSSDRRDYRLIAHDSDNEYKRDKLWRVQHDDSQQIFKAPNFMKLKLQLLYHILFMLTIFFFFLTHVVPKVHILLLALLATSPWKWQETVKCDLRTTCVALQILWKQYMTHLTFPIAVISDDVQRPEFSCLNTKLSMHHQCSCQTRGLALVIWRQSQPAQRRLQDLQDVAVRYQYDGHPEKRPRTYHSEYNTHPLSWTKFKSKISTEDWHRTARGGLATGSTSILIFCYHILKSVDYFSWRTRGLERHLSIQNIVGERISYSGCD